MNTPSDKITAGHLARTAIVFVRQSTHAQVVHHQESRRLQYALVDSARAFGFSKVEVIDDDMGRSGSGTVARPGFDALLGAVCTNEVGAILCIEDARLARNGRQWHHLIELCGLTGTLLIDPQGVYDPSLTNDRLLLGMKGSMAEFELGLIRQRSQSAIRAKAQRGELRVPLPVGLQWSAETIELDPDRRVQEAIHIVFRKYTEAGSLRKVLLWCRRELITLPTYGVHRQPRTLSWRLPSYQAIHSILTNPMYAGAYVFGRRETSVDLIDGKPHKTEGHMKPRSRWTVLIQGHHPGYISWEQYERNQTMIADNAHMLTKGQRKAGRGGRGLLVGLLRCRRCGRMLSVMYKGGTNRVPRYLCSNASRTHGAERCIAFGGLRPDEAITDELLRALETRAITAAVHAHALLAEQGDERRKALELELEQARYEAQLAARRYEAVDPDQRLVAAELEARWNSALERVEQVRRTIEDLRARAVTGPLVDAEALLSLAEDLPAVWRDTDADMQVKQRIVRTVIREIVADVDNDTNEIVLVIHWMGGRHSETRVPKNKPGHTSRWTDPDAVRVIRAMAGSWSDRDVTLTLNRLRIRTGTGKTWTESRLRSIRHRLALPAYDPNKADRAFLSLEQAAVYLGVSTTTVRRLIQGKVIPAIQVCPGAPWQLRRDALERPEVQQAIDATAGRHRPSRTSKPSDETPVIPGL